MNARDNLSWSHDSVDNGKDAAYESKDDGDGNTKDGEQPESERHEVRITKKLLFHYKKH